MLFRSGQYKIVYTVTTATDTFTFTLYIYFVSNAQCIVTKLWAKVTTRLCHDSCDDAQFVDQVLLADALLRTVKAKVACNKVSNADDIIARIERIGEINDCNCNS